MTIRNGITGLMWLKTRVRKLQGIKRGFERGEDVSCVWVRKYIIHVFRNDDV